MRARCENCNSAIEFTQQKGVKLEDSKCTCGGAYRLMRSRQIDGEAPLPGFTHRMFGKVYHNIYTGGGGEWLFDRVNSKFIPLPPSKGDNSQTAGGGQIKNQLFTNQ